MKWLIYLIAAVCGYLIASVNPAIIISKAVYKQDIRQVGSGNPGFTNFKRCYGNKWAWPVFFLDLGKSAVAAAIFGYLISLYWGSLQTGAAFTGVFCLLGHAYPIWYKFKGGKGFLVYMSTVFIVDWRAGITAFVIMSILLLASKYMSLSTMLAVVSSVIAMIVLDCDVPAVLLCAAQAVFIIYRHRENIIRLAEGCESRFTFKTAKK